MEVDGGATSREAEVSKENKDEGGGGGGGADVEERHRHLLEGGGKPECYFIVHNIAKKHNVGTLARCATAFGIKSVCLIGEDTRPAPPKRRHHVTIFHSLLFFISPQI